MPNMQSQNPRRQARASPRGFTLVEIMIVVTILGIIGAIVLPKFSDASLLARTNTLKDDLRYLRTQIVVFKAQHHDVPPGYPGGDMTAAPSAADYLAQMTSATDEKCNIGVVSAAFRFGPYLSKMPPNPINGLDTVIVVGNGAALPAPDGSTGWILKPQTQELIANLTGTDTDGVHYADY